MENTLYLITIKNLETGKELSHEFTEDWFEDCMEVYKDLSLICEEIKDKPEEL